MQSFKPFFCAVLRFPLFGDVLPAPPRPPPLSPCNLVRPRGGRADVSGGAGGACPPLERWRVRRPRGIDQRSRGLGRPRRPVARARLQRARGSGTVVQNHPAPTHPEQPDTPLAPHPPMSTSKRPNWERTRSFRRGTSGPAGSTAEASLIELASLIEARGPAWVRAKKEEETKVGGGGRPHQKMSACWSRSTWSATASGPTRPSSWASPS